MSFPAARSLGEGGRGWGDFRLDLGGMSGQGKVVRSPGLPVSGGTVSSPYGNRQSSPLSVTPTLIKRALGDKVGGAGSYTEGGPRGSISPSSSAPWRETYMVGGS